MNLCRFARSERHERDIAGWRENWIVRPQHSLRIARPPGSMNAIEAICAKNPNQRYTIFGDTSGSWLNSR